MSSVTQPPKDFSVAFGELQRLVALQEQDELSLDERLSILSQITSLCKDMEQQLLEQHGELNLIQKTAAGEVIYKPFEPSDAT